MSTSQVKSGFDQIAIDIANQRSVIAGAKEQLEGAVAVLNAIPSNYTDMVAEVNGYVPTGAFETLAKDELAKLTTEFQTLRDAANAAIASIS